MTFNEWKKGKESLFTQISTLVSSHIFDTADSESLDLAFSYLYGNRDIPRSMEEQTLNEVAKTVVLLNNKKWTNQYDLLYNEVVAGVANETIIDETNSSDSVRTLDRNTQENVSAFNDTDYSPDSENVEGLIDDNANTGSRNRVETRKSLWAIQEQMRIEQQSFIQDVVMKDISKLVTISVY